MSRVCDLTGARTRVGNKKTTRGLAKAAGGVGKKITGCTKRTFKVNLQKKRIFVPELDRWVTVRVSTRALRTISKKGAYRALVDAGIIAPVGGPKKKKKN